VPIAPQGMLVPALAPIATGPFSAPRGARATPISRQFRIPRGEFRGFPGAAAAAPRCHPAISA